MSSILFYVTGHGFGHAVRVSQVTRSLARARPNLELHVRTTAPIWLFPESVIHSEQSIDVGVRQRDSLDMELGETLKACQALHDKFPQLIKEETAFIEDHDISMILGDIPPLCFEIAARLSIPSVAIANFTWSQIYRAYLRDYPAFLPLIEEIEGFYGKATLALTLPYLCDMDVFPRQEPIPWIARVSSQTKEQARKAYQIPQYAKIVLLSFGGLGLERLPRERLRELREFFFVATGESEAVEGNVLILPNAQAQYENLVRAADVVVTKPGYGIVADVIAHQVPILYTDRGEFPEYPRLVQALKDCATAEFIPQEELLDGNLGPYLRRLLDQDKHWPRVSLDGAIIAVGRIIRIIESFG